MSTEQRSGDAAIEVVEYDTTWSALFLEERALAVTFRFDREGYTEAKSGFVRRVLEAA